MKHEIKTMAAAVLYVAEIDDATPVEIRTRAALEAATRSSASLGWADLSRADLSNANLGWADLRLTILRGADLSGANLRGANLRGANLRGASLSGADLHGADLSGADLRGAKIGDAALVGPRPILQIGPLGSRADCLFAYITNKGVRVRTGCFFGALDEFRAAVQTTHDGSRHGIEYAAAIVMIEAYANVWTPA